MQDITLPIAKLGIHLESQQIVNTKQGHESNGICKSFYPVAFPCWMHMHFYRHFMPIIIKAEL